MRLDISLRSFHAVWLAVPVASAFIYLCVLGLGDRDAYWLANAIVPATQGVTLMALAILFVNRNPSNAWSPIPWFLAACVAYFGFGPLLYCFGNQESVDFADAYYPVDQFGLLQTNLLNSVGISCVVFGVLLTSLFLRRRRVSISWPRERQLDDARRVVWVFLVIGVPINLFIGFPTKIGLLTWTPPAILAYLSNLVGLAIVPLWWLATETGEKKYRWLLFVVIASELIFGVATLSKLEILKTVLFVGLGRYLSRPNLREMVLGGLIVVGFYVLILSPFVTYGRILLGAHSAQSTDEVAATVGGFSSEGQGELADLLPGVQGWWTRFAYSNAQLFAMQSYDQGVRGTTLDNAFYVVIPRFLYPDKPLLSPGREFTWLVTGNPQEESFTGPGAFGEGYWNGGWIGALLVGVLMGIFIRIFDHANVIFISQRRFLFLPFMFFGLLIATRPDDWFLLTYLGGSVQAVGLVVILLFLDPYIRRLRFV